MQSVDTLDGQRLGADAVNPRAHCDQQAAQVDDLGLACGIAQHRSALGRHGGHQGILGRAHRHHREGIASARQAPARSAGLDVTGGQLDLRANGFERLQVQVDRAVADRAATGQRHPRLTRPRQDGAEHQDRRAHLAHDVIGRLGREKLARPDRHDPAEILRSRALDPRRRADLVEQMAEPVDIGQARQVAQRDRLIGQDRAGHQGERGVLRARDFQAARQPVAAANKDTVHRPVLLADQRDIAKGRTRLSCRNPLKSKKRAS